MGFLFKSFFYPIKRRWPWWLLIALATGVISLYPLFLKQAERKPAQFSPAEMEYAETLLEGDETPDPDVEIGPPYEDTLSVPSHDYTNQADRLMENERLTDYKRALTEELARREAERVKRELARKIIERNRKEGYDIVLDKDFNVISAKEIKTHREANPDIRPETEQSNPSGRRGRDSNPRDP